jgi:putative ATPase
MKWLQDSFNEFSAKTDSRPLADILRPSTLNDVFGQDHLLDEGAPLKRMLDTGVVTSTILWGPPGSGKTTIARLLAQQSGYHFESVSAVMTGVPEIKKLFALAKQRKAHGMNTILFVDEIHRFNRAQQDAFLPHVEDGTIVLVGATTENPSFELNGALLSRCKVLVLKPLDSDALTKILERVEQVRGQTLSLTDDAKVTLLNLSDGDGRYLLNMCEDLLQIKRDDPMSAEELARFLQKRAPAYDKSRDSHYNLVSALHKSLRGSDCDAALYWMCRMLDGGEDPSYILRRLLRCAIEDIGLADPNALVQAIAARDAYEFLGSPEGELAIVQLVIYLSASPKSNAAYTAHHAAQAAAKNYGSLPPPKHILNASTQLMKDQGYASCYTYDHDTKEGCSGQNYFPEKMSRQTYYKPVDRGFEREIKKRLEYYAQIRGSIKK